MPPIALPSSRRSSATCGSEAFGSDRERRVAEPDQSVSRGVDEASRPADEDVGLLGGRPRDLRQHLVVDPPRIARPARWVSARQRVIDLEQVAGAALELLPVDDVLE